MGLLKIGVAALVAATAAGCYAPELRDCTLSCGAESDCAQGQVCGSDHFCASPEIAGRCSSLPGDAGSNDRDAGVDGAKLPDARPDAPPDAATHAALTVSIEGQGRITVQGFTCDKAGPQNGMCVITLPLAMLVTAQAQGYPDWRFDKWTSATCATTPIATCTFTLTGATTLTGKFKKDD